MDNSEVNLDELYRLRASSGLTNIEYKPTGSRDAPYALYRRGMYAKPIAYIGNEKIAQYLARINDIVDVAIKLKLENEKLARDLSRKTKPATSPF